MALFRIGSWRVDPYKSVIERNSHRVRVEPKAMQVLVYLANRGGEVVEREEILGSVWNGSKVKAEVLTNAIWELRRALGDDSREPEFIQTVSGKGYRLVAQVDRRERRDGALSRISDWLRARMRTI
jgi:DNA-binding winged helix-turn-helix (wHTH) protein